MMHIHVYTVYIEADVVVFLFIVLLVYGSEGLWSGVNDALQILGGTLD